MVQILHLSRTADGTKAAVQADNIQADTSVVISSTPVNAEEKPDQK